MKTWHKFWAYYHARKYSAAIAKCNVCKALRHFNREIDHKIGAL